MHLRTHVVCCVCACSFACTRIEALGLKLSGLMGTTSWPAGTFKARRPVTFIDMSPHCYKKHFWVISTTDVSTEDKELAVLTRTRDAAAELGVPPNNYKLQTVCAAVAELERRQAKRRKEEVTLGRGSIVANMGSIIVKKDHPTAKTQSVSLFVPDTYVQPHHPRNVLPQVTCFHEVYIPFRFHFSQFCFHFASHVEADVQTELQNDDALGMMVELGRGRKSSVASGGAAIVKQEVALGLGPSVASGGAVMVELGHGSSVASGGAATVKQEFELGRGSSVASGGAAIMKEVHTRSKQASCYS